MKFYKPKWQETEEERKHAFIVERVMVLHSKTHESTQRLLTHPVLMENQMNKDT